MKCTVESRNKVQEDTRLAIQAGDAVLIKLTSVFKETSNFHKVALANGPSHENAYGSTKVLKESKASTFYEHVYLMIVSSTTNAKEKKKHATRCVTNPELKKEPTYHRSFEINPSRVYVFAEIEEVESVKDQLKSKFEEIEIAREDIAKFREQKEKLTLTNGTGSSKSPVKAPPPDAPVRDISHLVRRRKKVMIIFVMNGFFFWLLISVHLQVQRSSLLILSLLVLNDKMRISVVSHVPCPMFAKMKKSVQVIERF